MVKLDSRDKQILSLLAEDSRIQINTIAKALRVSKDTTNYRIRRLEKLNVIENYTVDVSYTKLGFNVYHIFLLLDSHKVHRHDELLKFLKSHDHVLRIREYSDRWDLEFVFVAKGIKEYDVILMDILSEFSDIVLQKLELISINTYDSSILPFYDDRVKRVFKEKYVPDKTDLEILNLLSTDSTLSTYKLAEKVDVSSDTVRLRIKKLHNSGIIKRFTFKPNYSLMNFKGYTTTLHMKIFNKKQQSKFKQFVRTHSYITHARKTLGEWDIVSYIFVDSEDNFHKTFHDIKKTFADIIYNYDTYVLYKEHYYNPFPKILLKSHSKS